MAQTKVLIGEYIDMLDKSEFINIASMRKQEAGRARLIDTIFEKMKQDPNATIEDVALEVEQSLYYQ